MNLIRSAHHEFWWMAEKRSGKLWHRVCADGISCWLDWLPAFTARRRYAAHRALCPDLYQPKTR